MALNFTTKARETEQVEFELDGETYTFTKPKDAAAVLGIIEGAGSTKIMLDWFAAGLGTEQEERILERLKDPEDGLDLSDLNNISEALIKEFAERPTKSPSGSTPRRRATGRTSTAKQSPKGSIRSA